MARALSHFVPVLWGCILLSLVSYLRGVPIIPEKYPLFKQCDPRWANVTMGGKNPSYDTICIQGCAMSSLSMALNGKGYANANQPFNPQVFNSWLQQHQGYLCISGNCNNLNLTAPAGISPKNIKFLSEQEKPNARLLSFMVMNTNPIAIAHVRNKTHFVLLTGVDSQYPDRFYVNDPFYSVTYYSYNDIADIITYWIQ